MENTPSSDDGNSSRSVWILSRVRSVVDYLFCVLYGLIGLEILLDLAGASESSGFKRFLNAMTQPFLGPFAGLFSDPIFRNRYQLRVSYMVAMVIYVLLHLAVYGLIQLFERKRSNW
jgi:uncharacterized protein YggT (Ycf19 family)